MDARWNPFAESSRGPELDGDVEVQRARGTLQRREGRADTAGFEPGDRGLAGAHPLRKLAQTQLGRLARVADLFTDSDRERAAVYVTSNSARSAALAPARRRCFSCLIGVRVISPLRVAPPIE